MSTSNSFVRRLFGTKVPSGLLLINILFIGIFAYFITGFKKSDDTIVSTAVSDTNPRFRITRENGYELINPVLLAESEAEDEALSDLKNQLRDKISQYKNNQKIATVSVYLNELKKTNSFSIDPDTTFNPGSLLKVPIMMAYLKAAETNPSLLTRKIHLEKHFKYDVHTNFPSAQLNVPGGYTIIELINAMIVESNNDATVLLSQNIDFQQIQKIFSDLHMPEPAFNSPYMIKISDYRKFFSVLYNATYLSRENSEYALSVLAKTKFETGIKAGLPQNLKLAHKYGESGSDTNKELHESGIVYLNNNPYLLVVMTKGFEFADMEAVIKDISSTVYTKLSKEEASPL